MKRTNKCCWNNLKQITIHVNGLLDVVCMGSAERETSEKFNLKKIVSIGIEPATPRYPTVLLTPLGHRDRRFVEAYA